VCLTALVNEWGDVDDGQSSPSRGVFAGFPVEGSAYQIPSPQAIMAGAAMTAAAAAASSSPGTAIAVASEAPVAVASSSSQTFPNVPPPVVLALPPMPTFPTGPSCAVHVAVNPMPVASSLSLLPRTRRMRTPTSTNKPSQQSVAGAASSSAMAAFPKSATLPSLSLAPVAPVPSQAGASGDHVRKPATYRQVSAEWGTSSLLSPSSNSMSPVVPPGHTHLCMPLETEPASVVASCSIVPSSSSSSTAADGAHVEPGTPMNIFGSPSASRLRVPRPLRRSWGPGMVVPDGDVVADPPSASERLPNRAHIVPRQPGPPVAPPLALSEKAPAAPLPESPGLLSTLFQSVKKSFTFNATGVDEAEESNKENTARLPPSDYTRPAPLRQSQVGASLRHDKPKVGATRKMIPRASVSK
jgi:hypothetical protein